MEEKEQLTLYQNGEWHIDEKDDNFWLFYGARKDELFYGGVYTIEDDYYGFEIETNLAELDELKLD